MYAFVEGRLERTGPPTVVVCGGIGYELWIPERHRLRLPPLGETVRLHTHLLVREDDLTLYGFTSFGEREIFRALISVNGVGPKVGLAVLGAEDSLGVLRGIRRGDSAPLLKIKGVGRKIAERIVLELEDKAAAWLPPAEDGSEPAPTSVEGELGPRAVEAVLALQALGVAPERARAAVLALEDEGGEDRAVEATIRAALRHLHPAR